LSERVKDESATGLNARTRHGLLVAITVCDIFSEMVEGQPLGSREDVAARAGVAKGTFVRFRARIFDPLAAEFLAYEAAVALAARHNIIRRSRGTTQYKGRHRDSWRPSEFGTKTSRAGKQVKLHGPADES